MKPREASPEGAEKMKGAIYIEREKHSDPQFYPEPG